METTRHIGLGLHDKPQHSTSYPPEAILSTAPASPTDDNVAEHRSNLEHTTRTTTSTTMPPEHSTMGQMSFGPATQQTITTVTTTTTVSLPPLVMKPPHDLYERDPKQYPLAFTPTPSTIKKFCFDVNGRPTVFRESEDPAATMQQYHELQAKIHRSNGSIRQEEKHDGYETPVRGLQMLQQGKKGSGARASNSLKRSATPVSIAEAAELASLQRKTKKQRSSLHRTYSEMTEQPSLNESSAARTTQQLANPSHPSPVTPDTDVMGALPRASRHVSQKNRTGGKPSHSRVQELQDDSQDLQMADTEDQDEDGPELNMASSHSRRKVRQLEHNAENWASQRAGATATPPITDTDLMPAPRPDDTRRPNLPGILTTSQNDASLPSPSLSPITAAANLASRQNAFDQSFRDHNEENASVVSGLDLDDDSKTQSAKSFDSQSSKRSSLEMPYKSHSGQAQMSTRPTIMDIPTMVDAFDSMPEAMQTYLMYQFLRRCAKPTLQMVANVVNPALKCDPFNILPAELGLNITRFLDAQSMCRAAQVSKRWRKLINSDEKAWKDLLERDGYTIPDGEIARAVREGWGWQHPGEDGYEEDLSKPLPVSPEPYEDSTLASEDELTASSTVTVQDRKRKVVKPSSSKKSKRRPLHASSSITKPTATPNSKWLKLLGTAKGANAFAHAAMQAVPHPSVGLDSLRNMHLFKSLYQRHYLIRKAWMDEESQPHHLAFRAHHRHVVTCLLFDSDKILTGSDDTKINVYDTKTGALRNRLEGHEGGVWALQYDGDILVSGSTDRSVRVWDIKSGRCLQVFQGHTSTVRCLVILKPVQVDTEPDGTPVMMPEEPLIITGSRDSTLRVWKLPKPGDRNIYHAGPPANDHDNPYFLRTLSGHHNSVRAIAAHGDTLVSGSYDCTVRVWKISNGDLVHRLQGHTQKVYSVVLDHARNRCISGSMDNLVKVWDLVSGACLFNLEGHTSLVGLLDLSDDRLVSAAADSTLRIWDPENGACKATLSAHTGAITCFQHDGQKVISGSDRTLKMWNVKNGECVRDLLTDLSGVWQVRFDERRCVAAVQRNSMTYIEVLDFGAARDGAAADQRGQRIVVDPRGKEIADPDIDTASVHEDAAAA
ncbi:Putative F-box domain, WD40/YVTN repeat-like-containing domain superfamily [Septoria linicola]|uniref:F-box domain, WD40/YVTN repeat-like-containing domain superfamily n=1 Tax=Septoria linicola TaxID=215465 RepID=A0A9Q9AU94_9PEZI|nr:putative F-box domain, WD40/YVTN repeat-like-containing domain superfamily [Septoria linicola]USW52243.1 Putative F-box domain, WD40/YVTN repeat-like-containing domain superfamily [Septoria linicola]